MTKVLPHGKLVFLV